MPPRVLNANDVGHGPRAWYESLPPITRIYGTVVFVLGLLATFRMINPFWIALLWPRISSHFEVIQHVYRVAGCV